MKNTELQLSDLKVSNLPELQGWKEKQEQLVTDNPYIEITDNKSYEVACKSRTALLKGRTELEKQDKLVASKLAAFRKDVKTETDILIAITLPSEEKQQVEVKRYEGIKEAERLDKERIEKERVEAIKAKIDSIETESFAIIQKMTFQNVIPDGAAIGLICKQEFDFEEYDILFEQTLARIENAIKDKIDDLTEREERHLENERMKQEIFDVRVIRFKELGFELEENLMFRSFELPHTYTKSELLNIDSTTFERAISNLKQAKEELKQAKIDAENLEKENKVNADKEKIFEIRKSRFLELGVELNGEYFMNTNGIVYDKRDVFNADAIDFETIITDAKLVIEKAKEEYERAEKQKAIDLELSKADAERLKKENKARVKRLAGDKKIISESLEVYFADLHLSTENEESLAFIITANTKVQALKNELLTELEKL